ncbi:MAG: putative glycoside hydrolase [Actinomycetota bacterium]
MNRRLLFRLLIGVSVLWVGWAVGAMAGRARPVTQSVIDDLGSPVPRAEIRAGEAIVGIADDEGRVSIRWRPGTNHLQVTAPGYLPLNVPVIAAPTSDLEAVLRATMLRGKIVDQESRSVPGAYVTASAGTAVSDGQGRFTVRNAQPGMVEVWRPAWQGSRFTWDGGVGEGSYTIAPETMKAVHIGGEAAQKSWPAFLEMAATTELNSLMLDLKDESGVVFYPTQTSIAREVGAVYVRYDLGELVRSAQDAGLYLIGRIVAFQDPVAALTAPEMAVWDTATDSTFTHNGQYFLDPTDPRAQAYALELAVEACERGVDEIQFDYVRFPDNRPAGVLFDGGANQAVRVATIRDFLSTAVAQLHPLGCAVGADIFGFITRASDDGGIGQQWEEMTSVLDVASPMLYPSHYNSGWYGFERPNDHPGELVGQALDDGLSRLARQIVVRPWLQDFGYTAEQVRAQIDEADARGLGWMLWNAVSDVSVEALNSER